MPDSVSQLAMLLRPAQSAPVILIFVAFVLFSVKYLGLKLKWMKAIFFIPALFFGLCSLSEKEMPWMAILVSLWICILLLPLLFVWFFHLTQGSPRASEASDE